MIITQDIYDPLYLDKEHFIILVTGGRGSGKSFNVAAFIESLTFEEGHKILYSRYTMNSATDTIVPEFQEKIDIDGLQKYFHTTKADVINELTQSAIMFRGIKTSSGNQTAKLKSIHGLTTFVCDEAEEWVSETDYDTLRLSIRQKGIQNRIIIIMNPTDKKHFIYQKYIKDNFKWVEYDGVPVQISTHPSVLHIHTTYLDNAEHLSDEFLREAEDVKTKKPERYARVYMGQWQDKVEGAIYTNWSVVEEMPKHFDRQGLAIDFGFSKDPTAIVHCGVVGNDLYIDEYCYKTHLLTKDIISEFKRADELIPHKSYIKTVSENAEPREIQEIANAGFVIYPVSKGAGSLESGIKKTQEFNIKITKRSKNTIDEFSTYHFAKDKDGTFLNMPEDGQDDHICDAVRYWIYGEILGKIQKPKNIDKSDLGIL